jgi:hypothetical protein
MWVQHCRNLTEDNKHSSNGCHSNVHCDHSANKNGWRIVGIIFNRRSKLKVIEMSFIKPEGKAYKTTSLCNIINTPACGLSLQAWSCYSQEHSINVLRVTKEFFFFLSPFYYFLSLLFGRWLVRSMWHWVREKVDMSGFRREGGRERVPWCLDSVVKKDGYLSSCRLADHSARFSVSFQLFYED